MCSASLRRDDHSAVVAICFVTSTSLVLLVCRRGDEGKERPRLILFVQQQQQQSATDDMTLIVKEAKAWDSILPPSEEVDLRPFTASRFKYCG